MTRLEDAGHYLQEDAQELIMPQLLRFLATLPDRLGDYSAAPFDLSDSSTKWAISSVLPIREWYPGFHGSH